MKKTGFIVCIFLALNIGFAQTNLVPNPSFEEYIECPNGDGGISDIINNPNTFLKNWVKPTFGTSDYFSVCATFSSNVSVPNNFIGYQYPHTGNSYVGVYCFYNNYYPLNDSISYTNGKEYVQVNLIENLKTGKSYCIEFYINNACNDNNHRYQKYFSTDNIGLYLSKNRITQFDINQSFLLNVVPQIDNAQGNILNDTIGWTKIKGVYTAEGDEKWITIGCFIEDKDMNLNLVYEDTTDVLFPNTWVSYYYIDDVSITEIAAIHNPKNDTLVCENQVFSKQLIAENGSLHYEWNTGDTSQIITINQTGKYWYSADYGCGKVTDTIYIKAIEIPEMSLGNDISQCANGQEINLNASQGFAYYTWNTGDTSQNITVLQSGIYYVTGEHICGEKTDTIQVINYPIPNPPQVKDIFYCQNEVVAPLQAIGDNLLWYNGLSDILGDTISPIPNTINSGISYYYVTQTQNNCESEKAKIAVKINVLPSFSLPNSYDMCKNEKIEIGVISQENYAYLWNTNDTTPTIKVNNADIYELSATNECGRFWQETEVKEYDCDLCMIIPNAFTPNLDENNDTFFPVIRCPIIDYTFIIFDRWGRRIVETHDINFAWNGTNKGQNVSEGVYAYRIFFTNPLNNSSQNIGGTITLIR